MFASAGFLVKLHALADQHLEPVAVYKPKTPAASKITDLTWCHDNTYIALLQDDTFPQIISTKDRTNIELVHTIQALQKVSAIRFKQNTKRTMCLGNVEGEAILYDTKNRSILKKLGELDSSIRTVDFNSIDEQLAISTDKSLNIFTDRDSENNFVKISNYSQKCSYVKFHPNLPNILGLAFDNGTVTLKDIETGENMISLEKHSAPITGIHFTTNQKTIITTGLDKKICIYDYVSGECVFCMNIHQSVTSSDISLDDICIAAGLDDGCISLYDIRDPLKPFMYTNAHNCPVNKVSFEKSPVFIEHLREKHSETTLMDSDFGDQSYAGQDLYEVENDPEEKFKQDIMKLIKTNMDNLEAQLNEHCTKFQNFIMSEFDSIQSAMNRWDVFNMGDSTEIVQALNSVGSKSVKTAFSKKSNGNS
ncbi:protein NEDD1-like [Diabrotica undecimpunctata]|uniref:protein NEDD1-like n=1 Tax=Diabrotica undecimpunctata TaxID=50387 RepID=UPI003B63AB56